jgi:thiol-disulfide isomerase/thioredoxin
MNLRIVAGTLLLVGCPLAFDAAADPAPATEPGQAQAPVSAPTLSIGDAAPPITIDTWLKGSPVPQLKKGETYVVEFWATWCGPCKRSIPHLTELQKRFKDKNVTIIGISSSERKGLDDVKPFVETMGDKMNYTIAWDKDKTTYGAWMAAAGQNGIPTAFVVNGQGQIAWIGHPVYPEGELDRVVDEVSSNRYDVKAAVERVQKIKAAQLKLSLAAGAQPPDTMGVLAGLDELMAVDTTRADEYAIKKLNIVLFMIRDYTAGYALAAKLVDENFKTNPQMLNGIAWAILDDGGLEKRDFDLALRAATRANELTAGKDPAVLNTLARAHFEKGEVAKAVELQTAALGLSTDENQKKDLQARLDKYQEAAKN